MIRVGPIAMAAPLATGGAVLAARNDIWLPVIALVAGAAVLARRHIAEQRRWLPALLAARALPTDGAAPEWAELLPVELAILSKGLPASLDHAVQLGHDEPDMRRWARSIDRLTTATHLLHTETVPGVLPRRGASPRAIAVLLAAAGAALIAGTATGSRWWLVPMTVGYAAALAVWTDWQYEHRAGPALLARLASSDEVPVADDDTAMAVWLAAVAHGRLGPLQRSVALIDTSDRLAEHKVRARRRLTMATVLLERCGLARSRRAGDALAAAAAAASAGAAWWLTM